MLSHRSAYLLSKMKKNVLREFQITYFTPFPRGKVAPNVREIDISSNRDVFPGDLNYFFLFYYFRVLYLA